MSEASRIIAGICEARRDDVEQLINRARDTLKKKARSKKLSRRDDPSWVAGDTRADWDNAAMDMAMSMGDSPDDLHSDADTFSDWVGDELHTRYIQSRKQLDMQAVIDELEDEFKWMRGSQRVFARLRRSFR